MRLGGKVHDRQRRIARAVASTQRAFPEVPGITAEELKRVLAEDQIVLVDVRTPAERLVSGIPGAVDVAEFESRAAELAGSPVVTYCTIGYRSSDYAKTLLRQGWDVKNLSGSILAWTHVGGELLDPTGEQTRRVHVFGAKWNLVADGYEPVW
jgi:sodium/bile acid cotransporter 7